MKNWRANALLVVFLLISAAIIGRLIYIQIIKGGFYKALSQGLHSPVYEVEGERGEIFLSNGESLAINVEWPLVFVDPHEVQNPSETAEELSQLLDMNKGSILESLNRENSYAVLKRRLSPEEVENIQNASLEGVYISKEKGRYYPQEELASQVTGFLGAEGEGQYGIEQSYQDLLNGELGLLEAQKGDDLKLTIDYNIQFKAEQLLKKAEEELEIEKGEILVIEPNSGEILAMANFPNFNPNSYKEYAKKGNLEVFKNNTTQELFEPGSVFKPITMSSALEEEKITPNTTYFDTGSLKIGGYTIYNYDQRQYDGELTMTNVLEKSINTGAVFVQRQLGPNTFLRYLQQFGFFESSGIDVQETFSLNSELKKGREINLATASFGQGIEVTPLQLVRAYCAIANGGKLVAPHLAKQVNGESRQTEKEARQVISSKTASQVTAMLVSVVENGFAKSAQVPGYFVAGKTGTAQVSFGSLGIQKKGYSDKTIQTFIGFAPAFNPRFLALIKLDNPNTRTAEYSAVPIFKELGEYIIHHKQIPPDYQEENP